MFEGLIAVSLPPGKARLRRQREVFQSYAGPL